MLDPDPKVRERARFEQGLLDYSDSQRPSQPRARRDAHIVEHMGGGVSRTTNVNTGAVTVNGIPVSRNAQRTQSAVPRPGAPAPGLPQPPTAGEVARNTTLHRDPNGGGKIVHKLPDGTTRNTDIRTGKVTVEDPRDHLVGNVLDEARETAMEGLTAIPNAIKGLAEASDDASVLDGTHPYSSDKKERRAAEERMKQRGDDVARAVQNPGEVLKEIARPYVEDLNSDKPERAVGRAAVDVGSMFATGGASAVIKGIKALEAVSGVRAPDAKPSAAAPPQKPDSGTAAPPQPGSGGPAKPGDLPGSPPNAPGQQNPADRPDSAPPAASAPANAPDARKDTRKDTTTPGTSSSSPNARDGRRTGVLPTPVRQPPASSRTSRGDSPAQRTSGTSGRDTSADDSRSRSTRRDTDTPPSRTSDGSESRQQPSDRTPDAGTNASRRARDTAEAATECATPNSFVPGTPVLLSDGTYKPIEQIKLGDRVLATDPTGNLTQGRPVIALIPGQGLKKLVRITVDTDGDRGNATGTVTATDEHPFWEARTGRWTDAEDLDRGNLLRTPDGRLLEVVDVHEWAQQQQVHNLTVDGLHTYYVNVGGQDVLTHNDGGKRCDRSTTPTGGRRISDSYFSAYPREFLDQARKYGKGGVRELPDGRVRFYGEVAEARTPGEMVGRRLVREWDPDTGATRIWHETLDHNGNVRIVRPDVAVTDGSKVHYMFDADGGYTGKW